LKYCLIIATWNAQKTIRIGGDLTQLCNEGGKRLQTDGGAEHAPLNEFIINSIINSQ
jgi:hypothetical protein